MRVMCVFVKFKYFVYLFFLFKNMLSWYKNVEIYLIFNKEIVIRYF